MSAIHQKEAGRLLAMLVGKDIHLVDCAVRLQQLFESAELDAMKEGMQREWHMIRDHYVELIRSGVSAQKAFDLTMMARTRAAEQLTKKDL